jgi:hypothetical protein
MVVAHEAMRGKRGEMKPDNPQRVSAKPQSHPALCPLCRGSGLAASHFDARALLDAIGLYVGAATFNSCALVEHAKVRGGLLQVAIGKMTARQLGIVLHRISIMGEFDGVFLEHQGRDKRGALWRVRFPATV